MITKYITEIYDNSKEYKKRSMPETAQHLRSTEKI